MLFYICVATLVIGIILCIIEYFSVRYSQALDIAAALFTIVGAFAVAISLTIIGFQYIGVNGYVAQCNERYESLTYQYENDIYDNDNDIGKSELMTSIREWNEDLAWRKENQKDFWIGTYIPNIYDQFEFINFNNQ